MNKTSSLKSYLFPTILLFFTISSGLIASLPPTSADISPIDDTITITVDSACTMGQTVLQSSNTLNPGETSTIGSSRIAAYCNDSDGYAIYAIGYTSGEYGNTNLVSVNNPNHTIPTGTSTTAPSTSSYWNMSLTPGTSTTSPSFIPTIENNFTTSSNIPANFTKVASYPSTTIPQQQDPTTSGSYFTTTYQSHISTTQPAGIYNGQVQYVMVHPTTAPAPTFMQDTDTIKSRLTNYGDTTQAIDRRDGKKYWITMLADGNIWMTQNLDFDIDANKTYTSADTDLPAGTTWTPSVSTYKDTTWNNSYTTPESYDPGDRYWDGNIGSGSGTIEDNTTSTGDPHYHIGNYYNWTAAVAMNDSSMYSTDFQHINQSICPSGWQSPSTASSKSFQNLRRQQGLTAGTSGNIHNHPTYFVYGGQYKGYSGYIGFFGTYTYGLLAGNLRARFFYFNNWGDIYNEAYDSRSLGTSLRCVAR